MDALSDPRAFLSAQEKRVAQMKAMGIEESDVQTNDLKLGSVKATAKRDDTKKGIVVYNLLLKEKKNAGFLE